MNSEIVFYQNGCLNPQRLTYSDSKIRVSSTKANSVSKWNKTFSILTATYNRAHTLEKVYNSLKNQTYKDFEWLIVDDGSSDATESLVASWLHEGSLDIFYLKKENGGKHRALNALIPMARGEFSLSLDSDDYLVPDALERMIKHWHNIPSDQRDAFAGISGLCVNSIGKVQGKHFNQPFLDSNPFDMNYSHGCQAERRGFIRTDLQKKYLFPEFDGETFLTEAIVWQRIGENYKTRYINETVCEMEYLEDGLTQNIKATLQNNPKGAKMYYQNMLTRKAPIKIKIGISTYFVRYALHAKVPVLEILYKLKSPVYKVPCFVLGVAFFITDKISRRFYQG